MNFYGRWSQRKLLRQMLLRDEMQVVLIYGRRRVGKSELIKQTLREEKAAGIYYECKETTEKNNLDSLSELVGETFRFPKPSFASLEELLGFLFKKAEEDGFTLVLDEYPYLRGVTPGLDSILQNLIDRYRDTSKVRLIICGSHIDIMKSLLDSQNPLYGRIDRTLDLQPMDYYESALFYEAFSPEDRVRLYSVFGGIPHYNRLIDPKLSVRENVTELIASTGARLENEVSMYLRSEISKITNANEVFEALARGFSRFSDILSQSHVSSSPTLADVLDKLIRMGLVRKEAPINDENNRRKAGYYIADRLSLFYYRYCFRYASQMSVMEPKAFYDRYIEEDFESQFVPAAFEEVCRQYLIRMNRAGKLAVPFDKIGRYRYDDPETKTNGEFDIVTEDPEGYVFYEAKFRSEPLTGSRIRQEIMQVQKTGLNCYRYGFISRSGFDVEPEDDLELIGLEQLYSETSLQTAKTPADPPR